MRKYLQNHFFLSEEGAKNMEKGILYSTFLNISSRSEERRVGKECRSRWSPYH